MPVRGSYDVTAMCLRAYDFFKCHFAELNKIVEAKMPVNPYDDHKVSLRRPHGNGDLDIVRASYTRCKANVIKTFAFLTVLVLLFRYLVIRKIQLGHQLYTLSKISNWSPYIFYASFKSKSRLNKMHASINKTKLYLDSAGHSI